MHNPNSTPDVITVRSGGDIASVLGGAVLASVGAAGLWLISSGRIGLVDSGWRTVAGAIVLTVLATACLIGSVVGVWMMVIRRAITVDCQRRRLVSRMGVASVWLVTQSLPVETFESVVIVSGTERGVFVSSFCCRIYLDGRRGRVPMWWGIRNYEDARVKAERMAQCVGLPIREERSRRGNVRTE